jgi:hypothetical protein
MELKQRGGARKGAGRKLGKNTVHLTFSIPITTAQALAEVALNKSKFVNEAILRAIYSQPDRSPIPT